MTATAINTDDLFETQGEAPTSDGTSSTSSPTISQSSPGTGEILSFPMSGNVRTQDIVLRMLLNGDAPEEIARTIGRPVEDVKKIARSEWAKREITTQLATAGPSAQRDTLVNLIRIQAFDAVDRIGALMKCGHAPTELGACKLALQYALPAPMKDISEDSRRSRLPTDPDAVRAALDETEREIQRRLNPNAV